MKLFLQLLSAKLHLSSVYKFTDDLVFPLIDSFLADSFLGQSTRPFIPSGASQPMGIFRSLRERKKTRFRGPLGQAVLSLSRVSLSRAPRFFFAPYKFFTRLPRRLVFHLNGSKAKNCATPDTKNL